MADVWQTCDSGGSFLPLLLWAAISPILSPYQIRLFQGGKRLKGEKGERRECWMSVGEEECGCEIENLCKGKGSEEEACSSCLGGRRRRHCCEEACGFVSLDLCFIEVVCLFVMMSCSSLVLFVSLTMCE